jgi:hypothetical protein
MDSSSHQHQQHASNSSTSTFFNMGCGQGTGNKDSRGGAHIMQDGTVDLQCGSGQDGNLHLCAKGHCPNSGFFAFKSRIFIVVLILYNIILYCTFFSSAG